MAKEYQDIRTGVIGVGSMGQNHVRVYNEISNLIAVADPDEEQGRSVAERFGAVWYRDYHEMLDLVDAVTIAVPTEFHRQIAVEVAKAGVNMLVEKPLASNVEDAEAIVESAETAGIILAVGHVERYNPVVNYAKKSIERGDWGKLVTVSARRVSSYPTRIKDVGVIFDLAIHDIDILRYLCGGEVKSVYALGGSFGNTENEDHAGILMAFASGIEGICEASWLTPIKLRKLALTCSTHFVELDYITQSLEITTSDFVKLDESNFFSQTLKMDGHKVSLTRQEPLKEELKDFLKATISDDEPLVSGAEGVKTVITTAAALDSLKTGEVVHMEVI